MDFNEKSALGCLVLLLVGLFSIVASVAVGIFFGVGFGFLAYALFVLAAAACAALAFKQAK